MRKPSFLQHAPFFQNATPAQPGAYFVTVFCQALHCLLGDVHEGTMFRNELGDLSAATWEAVCTTQFNLDVDALVIMPNHLHSILVAAPPGGTSTLVIEGYRGPTPATVKGLGASRRRSAVMAAPIASFKAQAEAEIAVCRGTRVASVWASGFAEHLLRNEAEWKTARAYIAANPGHWADDHLHPDHASRMNR